MMTKDNYKTTLIFKIRKLTHVEIMTSISLRLYSWKTLFTRQP